MGRVGNWTGNHTRQITKEEMKLYGDRFKQIRLELGWSKTRMGREMLVNQTTIRRWENGEAVPQREIREIAEDMELIYNVYTS